MMVGWVECGVSKTRPAITDYYTNTKMYITVKIHLLEKEKLCF
jgi:hypothetical protein